MKKILLYLFACQLFIAQSLFVSGQTLKPFEDCPGVSVAVTRPGFNANLVPHQIYLIDDITGGIQPAGHPIDAQINAFGLNNIDGFLYGMHETFNVANPFLSRVDANGDYENVGTILPPPVGPFKTGVINTAAGTMDDEDNYYFIAFVINLQNILSAPELYVGKIKEISKLHKGEAALTIEYKLVDQGTCMDELGGLGTNPLDGALQDIAFNPFDRNIYSFLPAAGGGKIARFNPTSANPAFTCIDPSQQNIATTDLSGLFFSDDTSLLILTIDGKFYKGNVSTGIINLVTQTTLPLQNNNLRGDMASCVSKNVLTSGDCPGLAVAITRPGINSTIAPHQIYTVNTANGAIQPSGHPINLQINGFGLNNKDGFLYGMHEVSDVLSPSFTRVGLNGNHVDLGTIVFPSSGGSTVGIINTAAATMDGQDNYYFTVVAIDTQRLIQLPNLYLGIIKNVSALTPGDALNIRYERIFIGTCLLEILFSISNANGLVQDIAYNPADGLIYTYIQSGVSPAPGKLAVFRPAFGAVILNCINPPVSNIPTQDLSGMLADKDGKLFILTIDGKFYTADPNTGVVSLIAQTTLPLLGNNLRGDMASCVSKQEKPKYIQKGNRIGDWMKESGQLLYLKIFPNPVNGNQMNISVNAENQTTAELRIIDGNGILRKTKRLSLNKGNNQIQLQVNDLSSGIFSAILISPSGQRSSVKFIRL